MNKDSEILIVGHNDIIENSLRSHFISEGFTNVFSSSEIGLNPTVQPSVYEFFQEHRPKYVFLASTRSGGIEANIKNPGEFIYHNLESQNNILYASNKFGVEKLLFFAGSCVYPKECAQPMKEDGLLTGKLEQTNESYSVAKIAGIHLCQSFKKQYGFNAIVMVPATVFGPGSNVDIKTAHVIGALIGKFDKAVKNNHNEITVWGTGEPRREFLYVDDFTEACHFLMERYDGLKMINVGSGYDVTIKELTQLIARISGFKGNIVFDDSKPDGVYQKLLDSSRMKKLGWKPKVALEDGLQKIWEWYKSV